MFQRRRRAPGIGLLFLIGQLYNIGFNRIPPITLSFIGINVAVYLRLLNNLPSRGKACVSAHYVWFSGDWRRLILATFYHSDDLHLYFNMASFVWKGISLEKRMGSAKFLYILSVFALLTNTLLVGLDLTLANITEDPSYIYTCAAGFSGVIFALKVLTTYNLPSGVSMVMGIFPVPMKWACWVELILIQLLVPNASFTGHLAGILVGLMYVKGPLKRVMDIVSGSGSGVTQRMGRSYTYHAGVTGRRHDSVDPEDEALQQAIRASLRETHMTGSSTSYGYDPRGQTAVRGSLNNAASGEPAGNSNTSRAQRQGPSTVPPQSDIDGHYGSGSLPYPIHGEGLYPRLPNPYSDAEYLQHPTNPPQGDGLYPRLPTPSAPPAEPVGNGYLASTLPCPSESRMPDPSNLDEVRRRRIQRFER